MGERSEDDIETRQMTRASWLPPVARVDLLPTVGVAEGTLCYVEGDVSGEEEIWEYRDGGWRPFD